MLEYLLAPERVNEAVEQFWQEQNASDANQLDVLLCIEEILSNVIRHGGEGRGDGDHPRRGDASRCGTCTCPKSCW